MVTQFVSALMSLATTAFESPVTQSVSGRDTSMALQLAAVSLIVLLASRKRAS